MFPNYVKKKCKNKNHSDSLPIYAFKSKETKNESHFNVPIWLLPASMDESQQNFK